MKFLLRYQNRTICLSATTTTENVSNNKPTAQGQLLNLTTQDTAIVAHILKF